MSDTKYKAFIKSKNKIVKVSLIDFNFKGILYEVKVNDQIGSIVAQFEDIKLISYTGQKDKNNVEIYDGDIIKMCYGLAKVFWNETTSCYSIEFDMDTDLLWFYASECEVIGNIYENLELLEWRS